MTLFLGIFAFLIGLTLLHKYGLLGTFLKLTGLCAAIVAGLAIALYCILGLPSSC